MPRQLLLLNAVAHVAMAALIGLVSFVLFTLVGNGLPVILAVSAVTVTLVVLGFGLTAPPLDGSPAWRVFRSLTSRESVLPVGLAAGMLWSGSATKDTLDGVVNEMAPIIVLILTFAIISGGMDRSGFFRYVTMLTLIACRGSISRMVIGVFALTSGLTYFISNDIVVLLMTPIILGLCRQAGIRDVRTILLIGSFVAANTLSMGLLFGSPTNIIVGVATGTGFPEYFWLMLGPTIVAAGTSLLVTAALMLVKMSRQGDLPGYPQASYDRPRFHYGMAAWLAGFAIVVGGYSYCLAANLSFYYVSLPAIAVACWGISVTMPSGIKIRDPRLAPVLQTVSGMPYGITGFAASFFVVAFALVDQIPVGNIINYLNELPMAVGVSLTVLVTAAMVNTINDLPAAVALSAFLTEARSPVLMQASLLALNIGCYLTPIGALAGIMFFHMLRQDAECSGMRMPNPIDLIRLGGIHFVAVALMTCATLPGFVVLQGMISGSESGSYIHQRESIISLGLLALALFVLSISSVVTLRRCLSLNPPKR